MDLFEYASQPPPPPIVRGRANRDALPPEFVSISTILRDHHGASQAITATEIARQAGIRPQASDAVRNGIVRRLIARHLIDFDFPVVAAANGYFRPATAEELSHYHRSLYSRIKEIAVRIGSVKRQAAAAGYSYRGRCTWEGGPDDGMIDKI